ncbi:molecular chaperone GrpE [Candidatus Hakubella thermalkaliphila]|uniref:Protein GrpE n=2 Tax=Candidatus Hakubella thermalkaliphila TaxID=2754717 RepID=A0A6V8Q9T8_9ACTN|nr:nucleotide exchange factor GrpE [Candidatus Hakubella thermalkaliphila]GFP19518.1 molecular chaperone GrpE [Candidatus Hakubella thermalkaliphila]GFP23635.1 molecular chaperone GrpE [Candidatus Hakubella thermalkaliphila]GFP30203.1 molecular chaperone GrpE [Candidatus Hakubella thermalkaliphila]GFP39360.1 molecular chaperone GrpE [Candidatus Hakubella thermalkaliphila]GFP41542.1 molecular chaperone GrpE [Candidatus Hakubella thermalkaliphila]
MPKRHREEPETEFQNIQEQRFQDTKEKLVEETIEDENLIVYEEEKGSPISVQDSESQVKKLEEKVKQLEAEIADYVDTLKRVQAQFENYKKRIKKEFDTFTQISTHKLVKQLLPVLDNLERALSSAESTDDKGKIIEGVKLIYHQFKEALEKEGLKTIDPAGDRFDPYFHEAIMQVESDEHEDNTVVEVFQKGYLINDHLLRPAIVKVSKEVESREQRAEG